MTKLPQTLVTIGKVSRPHGIAGELKVQLVSDYASALDVLQDVERVYLGDAEQAYRVHTYRVHQGAVLLKLDRIATRNQAEAARGSRVAIRLKDLPKLPEDQYYAHQLVGLRVFRESGERLGTLTEVLATGSNDVYVVETSTGEVLLPALASVIQQIDLGAGMMTVRVPEGLE